MLSVLVVILATFCGSNAQDAGFLTLSDCSKTTAIETLDLKKMEGKWYELASYGSGFSHFLDRCQTTTITAGNDGKSFVMTNDRIVKLINKHVKTNCTVEMKGDTPTGDLNLNFKLPFIGPVAVPLKVLGTDDYKNYIIFNACYSFASIFRSNLGFILTKKRSYEAEELQSIYSSIDKTLKKNGLHRYEFSLTNQRNCEDKSATPSNTDSAATTENTSTENPSTENPTTENPSTENPSTENASTDVSQTTDPAASTTGTVEEEKTSETPAASESATTAEVSDDETSTKPSETTSDEQTVSDAEKVAAS